MRVRAFVTASLFAIAVIAVFASAACEAPEELARPKSDSPESVTSTVTSTTSTSTTAAVCGDSVRDRGEQCDDGNALNLDGCDATCHFEQVLRFNALRMLFSTDALCPDNAIGGAIGTSAQDTLQTNIATAIGDGSISTLCQFRELDDLTGGDASAIVGCVTGTHVASSSYSGASDLDWWYHASPRDLGPDLVPTARLDATILDGAFTAGPGDVALSLNLGGGSAKLALSSVIVRAGVGTSRAPREHLTLPRGHREEEHLDPMLTSFWQLSAGRLCGNVSAISLATLPVPETLREGGAHECWEGYNASNSMLDVIVSGCSIFFVHPIAATQPDQSDPAAEQVGDGAPYRFITASDHTIAGCRDRSGNTVSLRRCLRAAAFSVAVEFTADRVMIIGVE